ncbi:MAG: ABC transporter substrate-binding protein [Acidimicrobiales bacterium]
MSGSTAAERPAEVPSTIEDWEALWAEERDAIVERIVDNGWGKSADGATVTGPEGFTIDLSACIAGWSDTQGLTDTSIKIGYVLPQSGPVAAAAGLAKAEDAVFRHQADLGGFTDSEGKSRTVELVTRDDGYDPARTIPLVDELIVSNGVFAVQTSGTPQTLRTYDKINQYCVPQPMTGSGHSGMGDPVEHPWTTNASFSYVTEAIIWATFIEERLDELGGEAKVAFLKLNNEGGATWETAFKAYLAQSPNRDAIDVRYEAHEPSAATITEQMTTLAAFDPDFFFIASTGTPCPQAVTEAAQNGMKDSGAYLFLSSTCKATGAVNDAQVGDASDGWWSAGGGTKDLASASFDDDPWIVAARQWITDAGHDYKEPIMNLAVTYGWTIQQALLIGGELPGGLTRSNFMLALRTLDMTNPHNLPGIKFNMNGNADAFLLEGSDISQWDAAQQAWIQQDIVDLSGRTPNCAWDQTTASCR